jgi:hypothetical protein
VAIAQPARDCFVPSDRAQGNRPADLAMTDQPLTRISAAFFTFDVIAFAPVQEEIRERPKGRGYSTGGLDG